MMSKRDSNVSKSNPIKNDPVLKELLQTEAFEDEDDFKGWRKSFLVAYEQFLDPIGRENAHGAETALLNTLKTLSLTVIKVHEFSLDGTITEEKTGVKGQRALTNMSDQMAYTEKALQQFMPSTQEHEDKMGYNKFELGAVLIADGFEVWEILKTTKNVILKMQDKILKQVCSSNTISVINFYLRQVESFADVMADLGLLQVMEQVITMYASKPRGSGSTKKKPSNPKPKALKPSSVKVPKKTKSEDKPKQRTPPKRSKSADVDLLPSEPTAAKPVVAKPRSQPKLGLAPAKQKTRAIMDGGYSNPLEAAAAPPKTSKKKKKDPKTKKENPQEDSNNNDPPPGAAGDDGCDGTEEIIYFDIKTGKIGKILRSKLSDILVVDKDKLDGQIDDEKEREDLLWAMKKAMKKKNKK